MKGGTSQSLDRLYQSGAVIKEVSFSAPLGSVQPRSFGPITTTFATYRLLSVY